MGNKETPFLIGAVNMRNVLNISVLDLNLIGNGL